MRDGTRLRCLIRQADAFVLKSLGTSPLSFHAVDFVVDVLVHWSSIFRASSDHRCIMRFVSLYGTATNLPERISHRTIA
jgi:hypothetical protein